METCLSTADQDPVGLPGIPAKYVTERTPLTPTIRQNTSSHHDNSVPVTHPADRSVNWSQSVDGPPGEEAVMQISGAGHWFLEGWIGDHDVDFLVDSGSAVTAVSTSFYKSLREVGAPVGEIRLRTEGCVVPMGHVLTSWGARSVWSRSWDCRLSSPF